MKFEDTHKMQQLERGSSLIVFLKLIDYSNAKSLACDTANEHALTCTRETYAAAVRQLSNGTNGDDLYIHIATVGSTIQTVNFPCMIHT